MDLHNGVTLIEVIIIIAIIGLLITVAYPSYQNHSEKVDVSVAAADIVTIESAIERYSVGNNALPATLVEIGMAALLDPWGNGYQYVPFDEKTKNGSKRKDKNLVPVNSDYDLYSMGKNGTTAKPFTSKPGRDDIVRANNGRFIGLADDY